MHGVKKHVNMIKYIHTPLLYEFHNSCVLLDEYNVCYNHSWSIRSFRFVLYYKVVHANLSFPVDSTYVELSEEVRSNSKIQTDPAQLDAAFEVMQNHYWAWDMADQKLLHGGRAICNYPVVGLW